MAQMDEVGGLREESCLFLQLSQTRMRNPSEAPSGTTAGPTCAWLVPCQGELCCVSTEYVTSCKR